MLPIPAIVLAAGASSRMGSPKPLLSVRGKPALEHIVDTLLAGGVEPVIVVLGSHAGRIRAAADLSRAVVVEHAGWAAGRTSSIQAGMAALPEGADSFLLALVDMPLVRPETVTEMLRLWGRTCGRWEAAVPLHGGRRGHPIVLSASLTGRLLALGPDQSLRDLVRTVDVMEIAVDDPGVLVDLDTPDDLARIADPDGRPGTGDPE